MKTLFLTLFLVTTTWLYGQPEKFSSGKLFLSPKEEAPLQPKGAEEKSSEVSSWLKNYQKQHPAPSFSSEDRGVDFTGQYRKQYAQKEITLPKYQTDLKLEKEQDLSALRGDKSYGEFNSTADAVGIFCRDYADVDGDIVDIYLNDELVVNNVYLRGDFQRLHIPLKVGFNKIEIKALNQGLYGPNTAEFRVIDDQNQVLINQTWALLTGYKARFVIVKDK